MHSGSEIANEIFAFLYSFQDLVCILLLQQFEPTTSPVLNRQMWLMATYYVGQYRPRVNYL